MLIRRLDDAKAEPFQERGARGAYRRTLVAEENGSRFFRLRFYTLQEGGQTPFDVHPYEHVVIITRGQGSVLTRSSGVPQAKRIGEGDIIYIGPNEPHQFINTGPGPLEFYCFGTSAELYEGVRSTAQADMA